MACSRVSAINKPIRLSLHERLFNNQGKYLYKKPLNWTDDHLQLFKCKFSESNKVDNGEPALSEESVDDVQRLATTGDPFAIQNLLNSYIDEPASERKLEFLFDYDIFGAREHLLRILLPGAFVLADVPGSICYLNLSEVERKREESGGCSNVTQKDHDPFVAATAIAMAQRLGVRRYRMIPSPVCGCFYYCTHIVAAHKQHQYVTVYTTSIADVLLELFDFPFRRPAICENKACFKIKFKFESVAYQPYNTFPARLGGVLKKHRAAVEKKFERQTVKQRKLEKQELARMQRKEKEELNWQQRVQQMVAQLGLEKEEELDRQQHKQKELDRQQRVQQMIAQQDRKDEEREERQQKKQERKLQKHVAKRRAQLQHELKQRKEQKLEEQKLKEVQHELEQREEQKLEEQKLEQQKLEQQKLEQQKLEQQKLEEQKLEEQKLKEVQHELEQREEQKLEEQKLEQQKLEQQKLEQQKLEQQKLEEQKLEEQKLEEQKLKEVQHELEQREEQKLEEQKLEQQKLEQQKLEQQKLEEQKLEEQKLEQQKLEQQKLEELRREFEQREEQLRREFEQPQSLAIDNAPAFKHHWRVKAALGRIMRMAVK
ncbi:hypothetical protein EV127DRAFT_201045 [Xylaria flabelliformis]|nr:hypothetical protein EV127DRAFT_201045 [Xylaria flabelliformis]